MDVVFLSRLQFALTIMFHYLFPPLTIGMGVVLVYLEGMFLKTKDPLYETAARFWTNLFALSFAIGVATGIVMEFQFGTNWAVYSRFVGDVFGSALAAEGIFAFFLESGFLAILVFGWDKVGPRFHFLSTVMVSFGSIFSAVWIIVANSWQQTPAGHRIVQMVRDGKPWFIDGQPVLRAEAIDFWAVVFNPSTVNRIVHTLIGAFILGSFFILSISAYYLLKGRHQEFARRSFSGALVFAAVASIAAPISGDFSARQVYRTQPAKLAAFEGHFKTGPADLTLFGIPDAEAETVHAAVPIPRGLTFLLHRDFESPVVGLDRFKPEDRPPVGLSYLSFHLMVALGSAFVVLTLGALYLLRRRRLFERRWLMWIFVFAVVGPFITNEAGWAAAEVGRQPWIVHPPVTWTPSGDDVVTNQAGVVEYDERVALRTKDAASEIVSASEVLASIVLFGLIYAVLFALWVFLLDRKIKQGPEPAHRATETTARGVMDAATARPVHDEPLTGSQ